MMNLSREKLKKLILQEVETTTRFARRVSRHDREQGAAEREFFGAPLEPPRNILDKATEKELLATIMKNDDKADIAYRALFVKKDPIAWKVYNRFKAQDKNIFGNEKEFTDEYWAGPEARARGKELFKQAQATKAARGPGETGGRNVPGRMPSPQTSAALAKFARDTMRETSQKIPQVKTRNKQLINYTPEIRAMKKSELLKIIREEVEVVLTNEEAVEIFDLDPTALIDEMMSEAESDAGSEFLKSKAHDPETAEPFKGTKTKRGAAKHQRRKEKPAGGEIEDLEEEKDWIQKAVDPEHEGDCTPMTKSTCTPARKALAKRFKKAARKKKESGGTGWQGKV